MKILLAEDIDEIRLLLRLKLESNEHIVHEAIGGLSACALLALHRYDVLILDCDMDHEGQGLDVIGYARKLPYPLRIIFATGREQTNPELSQKALEMGAEVVVVKQDLMNALRKAGIIK